jgi:PAS domain S-box-containing protein
MDYSDFKKITDNLPDALILLNIDGDILQLNQQAQKFFTKNFPDINNRNSIKDFIENSDNHLTSILKSWSRSKMPVPSVIKWKINDIQHINDWQYQGFMFEPANEQDSAKLILRCRPGGENTATFARLNKELAKTQITLRKLQETREALEKEHERAVVTLNSIGDAVITTDIHGNIDSLNPMAESLTGWSQTESQGRPSHEIFNIIDENTRQKSSDPIQESLNKNKVIELNNHTVLLARDGTEFIIEDTVAPIRNKAEEVIGAVLVFHDVTGDRLARRQL